MAHQLLLNGKPAQNGNIRDKRVVLKTDSHETVLMPFTIKYLGDAISLLKNRKSPGLDNIHHEISNTKQQQISNLWRKANVDARKIPRKPKEVQAGRSLLFVVQANQEEDPRLPSVQDRAQANSAAGRFQT